MTDLGFVRILTVDGLRWYKSRRASEHRRQGGIVDGRTTPLAAECQPYVGSASDPERPGRFKRVMVDPCKVADSYLVEYEKNNSRKKEDTV